MEKGELVGFLGPNGAGKSTTLKILTGILFPTGGKVDIMGYTPWKDRKKYVAHIGAVFGQKSQLLWDIPPIDAFYPKEPAELALRNICTAVKFVIFQEKLADGTRKVTSISEVRGSEGLKPIINQIYKFIPEDVDEDPVTGQIRAIVGKHKRVGRISDELVDRMMKAGIKKSSLNSSRVRLTPMKRRFTI